MTGGIDLSKVVPVDDMSGEDADDTAELRGMLDSAERFLLGQRWCSGIAERYFGLGVGGIVAVFAFRIVPAEDGVDEWLWVVVGDVPPAYLVVDDAPNPATALDSYIGLMEQWVAAVKEGRSGENLVPVNAPPTPEGASALERRLVFLDREILGPLSHDLD